MKTFNSNPEVQEQLQVVTDIIVTIAHPDKIFLLGSNWQRQQYESIFQRAASSQQRLASCTLLILLPELQHKEPHQWQDQLEQHCSKLLPVTTFVLATTGFKGWLQAGHPFAVRVWQQALVLYDAGNMTVEDIPEAKAPVNHQALMKEGISKAREFLAGADLYRMRQQYKMAAFMLHQAVEQALQALLKAGTGYHSHTHNIERLLQLCCLVSPQLADLFPAHTETGKRLLHLLQKAYISARYVSDYRVTDEELQTLTGKVELLLSVVAEMRRALASKDSEGVLM